MKIRREERVRVCALQMPAIKGVVNGVVKNTYFGGVVFCGTKKAAIEREWLRCHEGTRSSTDVTVQD